MYDAIVVGGRCAGAPTAMLLARQGFSVLLVDAAPLPSDMPLSTHLVWQSGAGCLRRWGLLDDVAASQCPPVRDCLLDFGPIQIAGVPACADDIQDAYAPRRYVLDRILLEAASRAGVEVRPSVRITELLFDHPELVSVRGFAKETAIAEMARIVIGADGRTSEVARLVEVPRYDAIPPQQGTYFAYWRDVPLHRIELHVRPGRGVYAFPTNDDLTLIGVNWAIADFKPARADPETSYHTAVATCAPALSRRLGAGIRASHFIGGAIGNFLRKPYGDRWALVGDAGMTMDPCTAGGISNAFRDAELLADAVGAGLSGQRPMTDALAGYHRRRDAISKPIYDFTCELAAFAPPTAEMAALIAALADKPEHARQFLGVLAQTVTPAEFFAPENIQQILQKN